MNNLKVNNDIFSGDIADKFSMKGILDYLDKPSQAQIISGVYGRNEILVGSLSMNGHYLGELILKTDISKLKVGLDDSFRSRDLTLDEKNSLYQQIKSYVLLNNALNYSIEDAKKTGPSLRDLGILEKKIILSEN